MLIQFQLMRGEEIKIGTLHGQLRFDPEIIAVEKGADVRLVFENPRGDFSFWMELNTILHKTLFWI